MRRLAAALVFLSACNEPKDLPISTVGGGVTPIEPPEVVLFGCLARVEDTCVLVENEDRELRIWIDQAPGALIDVLADDVAGTITSQAADGGQRLDVTVGRDVRQLSIRGRDPPWTTAIGLEIARARQLPSMARAEALARGGEFEAARELLRKDLPEDPEQRMRLLDLLTRLDHTVGDRAATLSHAEAVASLAAQLGYQRYYADAAFVLFWQHFADGDYTLASAWADRLARASEQTPELGALPAYQSGLLASAIGDADRAERSFAAATRLAERSGDVSWLGAIVPRHALALAELGRADEARTIARNATKYIDDPAPSCLDRLTIIENLAWTSVRLAQSGLPHDPPYDLLDRLSSVASSEGTCPNEWFAQEARIIRAFALLLDEEPELARDVVDDLAAHELDSAQQTWAEELAAQVALATGRWDRVSELAPIRMADPTLSWIAALRYAETIERLGFEKPAADAYVELEERLDRAVRSVGVEADQERFLAARSVSAQRLVELLLRRNDPSQAMCRARLAISRAVFAADRSARTSALPPARRDAWHDEIRAYQALRTELDAELRSDWQLPADELHRVRMRRLERLAAADARIDALLRMPAAPGGCERLQGPSRTRPIVVGFETTEDIVVFIADGEHTEVVHFDRRAPLAVWEKLLAPPMQRLAGAERITVVAAGAATEIPFHALEHAGSLLLADTPVAYGLDLAVRRTHGESPMAPALIVADPRGDLEAAGAEADAVADRLQGRSRQLIVRRGTAATREAVLASLGHASLLHYAGHGSRGRAAWDASLRLAEDTELRIADILTLPQVPRRVVLAGCHTGRRDDASLAGGMNLGRAFVLAGSEAVLVADAEVDDQATRALSEALYEDPDADLPTALRRAQVRLREQGIADWASFRVLVP